MDCIRYKTDLPVWIDDVNVPSWGRKVAEYYRDSYIMPKADSEQFSEYLEEILTIEEISLEQIDVSILKKTFGKDSVFSKAWKVIRDEKSELYYRYYYMAGDINVYRHGIIIIYVKSADLFYANSNLLLCRMKMLRGINQSDIEENSREYFSYGMAFCGYNCDLRQMDKKFGMHILPGLTHLE